MSLQAWMRIGKPLEPVMNDYEKIFAAWETGGVSGYAFGPTLFADDQFHYVSPYSCSSPGS